MTLRQIVLDTETTGIRVEDGHRIIEIGCIEMINRKTTDNHFHFYLNPEREVEAGALAVHGITNEFLQDKPLFRDIAKQFIDYVKGAELIIHNAPFDTAFLNNELMLLQQGFKAIVDYCQVTDTLQMARRLHVGQRNNLDALCKRYKIDNSKRELHGALMDAHLLAQVYLAMTGGQSNFFDAINDAPIEQVENTEIKAAASLQSHVIHLLAADETELTAHKNYLKSLKEKGKCLWED